MKTNKYFLVSTISLLLAVAYLIGRLQTKPPQPEVESSQSAIATTSPTPSLITKPVVTYTPTPTPKPKRVATVINAQPWPAFTAYCDSDSYTTIQDAIKANNDMNQKQLECIRNSPTYDAKSSCYDIYPMGEKGHYYSQVLLDALSKYCGCTFSDAGRSCPQQ